jgi:phosphoribosyl 1,2-cyclic phosphate phosphodiesterase
VEPRQEFPYQPATALFVPRGRQETNVPILIDTSTDFRAQALRYKIPRVDAVLFTHAHADHILGLEDLRGYNFAQGGAIPCYGTAQTLDLIKRSFFYIFDPSTTYQGGLPAQLTLIPIQEYSTFSTHGITIESFPVLHGTLTVSAYRFGSLAYVTDCKSIPETSWKRLEGLETLILDGLRYEQHLTHFTIPEAIAVAQKLQARRTILIHMTHSIDYDEVSAKLPQGIELGYDGLEIKFQ